MEMEQERIVNRLNRKIDDIHESEEMALQKMEEEEDRMAMRLLNNQVHS